MKHHSFNWGPVFFSRFCFYSSFSVSFLGWGILPARGVLGALGTGRLLEHGRMGAWAFDTLGR